MPERIILRFTPDAVLPGVLSMDRERSTSTSRRLAANNSEMVSRTISQKDAAQAARALYLGEAQEGERRAADCALPKVWCDKHSGKLRRPFNAVVRWRVPQLGHSLCGSLSVCFR